MCSELPGANVIPGSSLLHVLQLNPDQIPELLQQVPFFLLEMAMVWMSGQRHLLK